MPRPLNEKESSMQCNVGTGDRIFRLVAGVVIIALGIYFRSWWGALGAIPLLTGITRWCPLYLPLKINTGKTPANE